MQVRVKGRRQGNVCGRHEVNLVTTARREYRVGTPTRGRYLSYGTREPESQLAIFTGCASYTAGWPASPLRDILCEGMYRYHGSAQVTL